MTPRTTPLLSALEARVLAVLVEKRHTVPDTYPLTLNALVAGCNQKTSRDAVMFTNDAEVQGALDRLKQLSLVIESSGSRVMRYSENTKRVLQVPSESVALLAVLILRGAQTAAELRMNSERLQKFSDGSAVEAFLHELAQWPAGALVAELPRQPGARENRWVHLLGGVPAEAAGAAGVEIPAADAQAAGPVVAGAAGAAGAGAASFAPAGGADASGDLQALKERVARLEQELRSLRAKVDGLRADSGPS